MNPELAAAIIAAWTVPGPVPGYHYRMQDHLRAVWPTLAAALDAAAREVK